MYKQIIVVISYNDDDNGPNGVTGLSQQLYCRNVNTFKTNWQCLPSWVSLSLTTRLLQMLVNMTSKTYCYFTHAHNVIFPISVYFVNVYTMLSYCDIYHQFCHVICRSSGNLQRLADVAMDTRYHYDITTLSCDPLCAVWRPVDPYTSNGIFLPIS